MSPYGTGISREKNVSFVFAGEVIRFLHAGDECLTVPPDFAPDNAETNIVVYEGIYIGLKLILNLFEVRI